MESKQVGPVRDLAKEPLTDGEIQMLAEGHPPSSLGGLDFEEVITHMADRIVTLLEIATEAAEAADETAYSEFNDDSAEHINKIHAWKVGL